MYAVHATHVLPSDGNMIPGGLSRKAFTEGRIEEPPAFRPTLHFALGGVVSAHGRTSWNACPYAIMVPLENIMAQLVNVSPQDTFTLGKLPLSPQTIVVAPENTDTTSLPPFVKVRTYTTGQKMAETVRMTIRDEGGLLIDIPPQSKAIGGIALLDSLNVNNTFFFSELFQRYPHISFGGHLQSEKGNAHYFGEVDYTLQDVMKVYDCNDAIGGTYGTTPNILFFRAIIVHGLQALEESLQNMPLAPASMEAYNAAQEKVRDWLNIVDCDLRLRQTSGKTLANMPPSLYSTLQAARHDVRSLQEIIKTHLTILPYISSEAKPSASMWGRRCSGMSPSELSKFSNDNEGLLNHVNVTEFLAHYATERWMTIGTAQAYAEGLHTLLDNAAFDLAATAHPSKSPWESIEPHLVQTSSRISTSADILALRGVRTYFGQKHDMHFTSGGPGTLEDILRAHPKTRSIFLEMAPPDSSRGIEYPLDALGYLVKPRYTLEQAVASFSKASLTAQQYSQRRESLREYSEAAQLPMETALAEKASMAGEELLLYELLKRDYATGEGARHLWRRIGLEKEYQQRFASDDLFWNSHESFATIYSTLLADKDAQQKASIGS